MLTLEFEGANVLLRTSAQLARLEADVRASGHYALAHLLRTARDEAQRELGGAFVTTLSVVANPAPVPKPMSSRKKRHSEKP